MEAAVEDTSQWSGPVGLNLSTHLYVDMSTEQKINDNISQLKRQILGSNEFVADSTTSPVVDNDHIMPEVPSAPKADGFASSLPSENGPKSEVEEAEVSNYCPMRGLSTLSCGSIFDEDEDIEVFGEDEDAYIEV